MTKTTLLCVVFALAMVVAAATDDVEYTAVEAVPVIDFDEPALLELQVQHPSCIGGVCPIVDGVCCPSGRTCCPENCVRVNITGEECRLSDAHQTELIHVKIALRKTQIDDKERLLNKAREEQEVKARDEIERNKEYGIWRDKIAREKENILKGLEEKRSAVMKQLEQLAAESGIKLENVLPQEMADKLKQERAARSLNAKDEKKLELELQTATDDKQRDEIKKKRRDLHARITLLEPEKGWSNFSPENNQVYDPLRVQRWRDLCFLSGTVTGTSGLITVLPEDCRPKGGRIAYSLLKNQKPVRIDVKANGKVFQVNEAETGFLSLSGIVFDRNNGTDVFLTNGWNRLKRKYRWAYETQLGGLCTMSGLIIGGHWGAFGEVSDECKPDFRVILQGNNNHHPVRVDVFPSKSFGTVTGTYRQQYVALDGMIWTTKQGDLLSLREGWENHRINNTYRAASYQRIGNVVVLSGVIRKADPVASDIIATLPEGYRPLGRLIFGSNHHTSLTRIDVDSNGDIVYSSKTDSPWVTLDNIAFYVLRDDLDKLRNEENRIELEIARKQGTTSTTTGNARLLTDAAEQNGKNNRAKEAEQMKVLAASLESLNKDIEKASSGAN